MLANPEQLAALVVATIKAAVGPLNLRLEATERREPVPGRDGQPGQHGRDGLAIIGPPGPQGERGHVGPVGPAGADGAVGAAGRDADEARVVALEADVKALSGQLTDFRLFPPMSAKMPELVKGAVAEAVAAIPLPTDGRDGKDGASVTVDELRPFVVAAVEQVVAALPPAKDGAPGASVEMADVEALVEKAIAAIPRPKDGASVTVDDVRPLIAEHVEQAVASLPRAKDGQDGTSVTLADVAPLITGEVLKAIPVRADLEPDDITAHFSGLLTKEFAALSASVPSVLMQKRVIRDAQGRAERVVEEPVAQ